MSALRRWPLFAFPAALALACFPKQEQRPDQPVAETWTATPEVPSAASVVETDAGILVVPAATSSLAAAAKAEEAAAPDAGVAEAPAPPPPPKLATDDPGVRSSFQRAVDASKSGDFGAAERELRDVVQRDPKLDYAWTNLGIVQERMGRLDDAERSYRRATEVKPDQDTAWESLALLYARTGRSVRLEAELRGAIAEHPENLALRNALVTTLVSQEKLETAINEAKKVLKADERNVHAMQQLALAFAKQGKLELSRMVLENARAIDAADGVTQNLLGNVYMSLKQKPAALEAYQKAIQLRPDFAEALNNYGALLNQAQDYEGAVKALERAVASAPELVPARLNLGNAYRGLQEFDKALEQYKKAQQLKPTLQDVYFNLAVLHLDADGAKIDPIDRLKSAIAYFIQYRDKGGRDERVDQYMKDAQKGIEKEERRRERERKDQLRKAEKEAADRKAAEAQKPASQVEVTPPESGKLRDQEK